MWFNQEPGILSYNKEGRMNKRSRDVLLINVNRMKPPVSPVAIDFLASVLRAEGYSVTFLDLVFEADIDSALENVFDRDFLFVGLTIRNIDDSFFASQDFSLARVRPIIKKIRSLTSSPVILGGVGYSIFPVAALDYCAADMGIQGDGETAIIRLADALFDKGSFSEVPGLVFKSNGQYINNTPASSDLSAIDLSDRSTVDNLRYFNEGGMVGFESKRGCAASCSYCADVIAKGSMSRQRDPSQVAREVKKLVDKGIDHFQTCDSEFNIPHKHALEVCRAFIKAGLGERVRWYAYMTPTGFDEELALLMKRSGCAGINFGVDHCNPTLLKVLGRVHTAESIEEASRLCHKHEITSMFDLLLGAPGETPETLREVINFMKRIDPSCVGASMGVRLYPGTSLSRFLAHRIQENGPGIYGMVPDNASLLHPVYYLSPDIGDDPHQLLVDLVDNDERFFVASSDGADGDFNYNDNSALSEAIRAGERGTFWDILRRLKVSEKCT